MENSLKKNTLYSVLYTSLACIAVCLVCDIVIFGLLEHHSSWSGISAMYLAMGLATVVSSTLQTSYISIRHNENFFKVLRAMFLMVLVSMIGMGLAEMILHSGIHSDGHTIHESMKSVEGMHHHNHTHEITKTYMHHTMITPFALGLMFFGG
ncbi:MAG: DUF4396 domain-containing protein, partial [Candidatus Kapabacteria bacterium]|nr:DUF4396 domain-containing protein [Candidatus Kapabacteria bacterium]